MKFVKFDINYQRIREKAAAAPVYQKYVDSLARREFNKEKVKLLEEFDEHPVTQEIESKSIDNPSGTLAGVKGGLWGFIGFESGDEPVGKVRNMIKEINLLKLKNRGIITEFKFHIPSKQELDEVSPIPWMSGMGWVNGIESGITGIRRFLGLLGVGRSEQGLQVSRWRRGGYFKTVKYLPTMLKNFAQRMRNKF